MRYRRGTQKAFLKVAEQGATEKPVAYLHPAHFQAGEEICRVHPKRLGLFLLRLSRTLSFEQYDRLTRAIWVAHLKEPTRPAWPPPYRPSRRKDDPTP